MRITENEALLSFPWKCFHLIKRDSFRLSVDDSPIANNFVCLPKKKFKERFE